MSLPLTAGHSALFAEFPGPDTHCGDGVGSSVPVAAYIPIDPALLAGCDGGVPHRPVPGADEHAPDFYAVSSAYPSFSSFSDIPPPPPLEEQHQLAVAHLPPTPPLSLVQHKPSGVKRARRKERPQKVVPERVCSFCEGNDQKNKLDMPEQMVSCAVCGSSGHPSCAGIQGLDQVIRTYAWRCQECKECEVCKSKGDDSKLLLCDKCDRGWHYDCLTPPLHHPPRGDWACPLCTSSAPSTSKLPGVTAKPSKLPRPRRKSTAATMTESTKSQSPVIEAAELPVIVNGAGKGKGKAAVKSRAIPFPTPTPDTDPHSPVSAQVPESNAPTSPRTSTTPALQHDDRQHPPSSQPGPTSSPTIPNGSPQAHRTSATTLRFKRTTTQAPVAPRPLKVRIRLTSKSDAEGSGVKVGVGTKDDGDGSDGGDAFGGVLDSKQSDTSKTTISKEDKDRFEASRAGAETRTNKAVTIQPFNYFSNVPPATPRTTVSSSTYQLPGYVPTRSLRSAPALAHLRTGSPPPSTPTISTPGGIPPNAAGRTVGAGEGLRIKMIRFGQFEIDTWYDAPFPEEFSQIPEGRLWMCEFCLKYMRSGFGAGRHKMKCKMRCPPGDEIYRDGRVSVFEVDGRKNKIYCQNLCLLSKMFLDHKSLFYDVEPFLFYVMTEVDDNGARFVGYFSKEKMSPKDYNKEGRTGTPERPLSALGALSYRNYWKLAIMLFLRRATGRVRIRDISAATSITPEDVYETLRENRLITGPGTPADGHLVATPRPRGRGRPGRPPGRPSEKHKQGQQPHGHEPNAPVELPRKYSIRWNPEEVEGYVANWERKGHLRLKPDRLKWVPYRLSRAPVGSISLTGPPTIEDAAERSESDDEPQSDGSEDSAAPTISVAASVPRSRGRPRIHASHPSEDEAAADAEEDGDEDRPTPHVMMRRSGSRQSMQNGGRFDTPERRMLRSTNVASAILSRKVSMQSHLGVGRRGSPDETPSQPRTLRSRSMQQLRPEPELELEQTTPVRRQRGRPPKAVKEKESPPSPPVRRPSRRGSSPTRKRRRIEPSPEDSPPASPGKRQHVLDIVTNGHESANEEGDEDADGEAEPDPDVELFAMEQRDARSVSLGSGMVYPEEVRMPSPPVETNNVNGAEGGMLAEPARAFPSDSGSPLTSVKEELTDDASEGPTFTPDIDDDDALGDEDAEGEPDEDAEGEPDESLL
ncbi:histone acetyltransferase SAS3 [Ceratobasidium sp. AG-Ba]|nr:histone acetyltransferase SAS3 [Ceratobasidium sp. AG-Ba]